MTNLAIWVTVLILALVAEGATAGLVAIWFMPSALLCIALELLGVHNLFLEIALFFIVSGVLFALFYKKVTAHFSAKGEKTNADALVGRVATVEEDIPEGGVGRVKVSGQSWSALCDAKRDVIAGEKVKVLSLDGVKLICEIVEEAKESTDIVGKKARVEQEIDNFKSCGKVLCDGKYYFARSESGENVPEGSIVDIVSFDGKIAVVK